MNFRLRNIRDRNANAVARALCNWSWCGNVTRSWHYLYGYGWNHYCSQTDGYMVSNTQYWSLARMKLK